MSNKVDISTMFEEGGKEFDELAKLAATFPDDLDEPEVETKVEKHNNDPRNFDVFSLKVEGNKKNEVSFDDVYVDIEKDTPEAIKIKKRQEYVNEVMKKSAIGPDFEKLECVPPYNISLNQMKREKLKKRNSSKGENWFNMPAAKMTDELKYDLQVLQMRSALDPKRFYKKNDMKDFPKFFHVGTVVESPADYYSSRVPKKQRRTTMVDELLADAEFQKYNKQRYKEIIEERRKTSFKAFRHANRLKRKGKGRKS